MKLWQAITAAALVWAAVFLPGLGTQEIKGEEGHGILPGKNMLMHGEWAVPHIGGKVYRGNPPLMNWLAAASFKFSGSQTEWAARLPSVAAVLAMTLCMVAAGSVWMRGAGVAFMAAVFAMTNLAILEKGRLAELDPLYVSLTCIAFALWSKFFMEERSPWLTWTLPWVFLGLGLLTKGSLHLLFFYGPVIGILIVGKRWRLLLHPAHGGGILVMLAMVLPWVFLNRSRVMELSRGEGAPGGVWAAQMGDGLSLGGGGILSWVLTPFEAFANYLPWGVLLVFLWWRISQWRWNVSPTLELQLDRTTRREWMRGAAWGIAASFLLVALLPQSSARHLHPTIGPASMLLAVMVSQLAPGHAIYDRVSVIWKSANRVVLVGFGVALFFAPPITLFWGSWVFPVMWFAVGCLICGVAVFVGWKLTRRDCLVYQTGASACALAAGIQLFSIAVLPAVLEADNVRPVGRAFAAMLPETARLCVLNPGCQPFLFYLAAPYEVVAKSGDVPAESTHLLMSDEEYQKTREEPLMRRDEFAELFRSGDKEGKMWLLFGRRSDVGPAVD